MIASTSTSKTPPNLRSSSDPTNLAPGFRFHPTDEELLSYYLKRKITNRPIPVEAISDIDIYSTEPWDLPSLSHLRTRDLEWYFFTSLGRKYSNRCRTNRATLEGYWKTTGKDRAVMARSRVIGMKKTLVYHLGRAPRGQRTNWVMHEYRLLDESLSRAGIQQDAYVLCKIFEKIGAGPQNGAQYGAPFIEEEWEREDGEDVNVVPVNDSRDDSLIDPAIRDFVHLSDLLPDQDSEVQLVDVVSHPASSNDEDHDCHTEDPSNFLVESVKEQSSDGDEMPPDADFCTMQVNKTSLNILGKQKIHEYQSDSTSIQNNYVQLKDIFDEENTSSILNIESADWPLDKCDNNSLVDDEAGYSKNLPHDAAFIDQPDQLCMCHDVQHDYCLPADNLYNMPSRCSSGQLANVNLAYYDAASHEVPYLEGLTNEFDPLDELMEFFDATDDNLNYLPLDSFQPQLESSASKEVASSSSSKEVHVLQNLGVYESLKRVPSNDDPSSGWNDNLIADTKPKDCQDNALTKRLATLLNAISAPPALADEAAIIGKLVGKTTPVSSDTVHVVAGMIRIQSLATSTVGAESWKMQKHSEMNFLLTYDISKSVRHERRNKVHGGFLSTICWVGFHLFLLCSFLLALSCKLGVSVQNL